jgi:hypothetical protein
MHLPTVLIMLSSGLISNDPVLCRAVSAVKIDAFSQFPEEEEVYSLLYFQSFSGALIDLSEKGWIVLTCGGS